MAANDVYEGNHDLNELSSDNLMDQVTARRCARDERPNTERHETDERKVSIIDKQMKKGNSEIIKSRDMK